MTQTDFNALVTKICNERNLQQEEVFDKLADYLRINYSTETAQTKREAINEVKRKVLTILYDMANHSLVGKKPNIKEIFGLDDYEMQLAEVATSELEVAGLIEGGHSYTKLTPNGVLYVRELNK